MIQPSFPSHPMHKASTQQALESDTALKNKANTQNFSDILSNTLRKNNATPSTQLKPQTLTEAPKTMLNTDKGNIGINLDQFFSNESSSIKPLSINELPPLLLPSAQNIKALSIHASSRFKQMLSDYHIPAAPNTMTYDSAGAMQLPANYTHATELKQALKENPGLSRELSTINALSSHYVEIMKRVPFTEEMSSANSQVAVNNIIAKYSHLLNDNHSYSSLALSFSREGNLSVIADGAAVTFS